MPPRFFNSHSHRKPADDGEFVCRNAYHFFSAEALAFLPYPVSVGIHPWHASQMNAHNLQNLREASSLANVLAIGECGLDKRRGPSAAEQMSCWENQFTLARDCGLPLIVHCVRAWQEVYPLLLHSEVPVMLHDFRGNEKVAESLTKNRRVFFSFGLSLIRSAAASRVFSLLPEDRLLLETDTSSAGIREIYFRAAEIRAMETGNFEAMIKKNNLAFFGEKALPFF